MQKFKDMTGQRFGRLTVIERDLNNKGNGAYWLCKCDCGNIASVSGGNLRSGSTKSCGCLQTKLIDLTGQRFGRLTVIERDLNNKSNNAYWLCKCDCGNIKSIYGGNLRTGFIKSCGCLLTKFIDLTGQRFGKLTVIERDYSSNHKQTGAYWLCKCDCGNITSVSSSNLRSGSTKSCGCLQTKLIDLTGQRFGRLTVIERDFSRKGKCVYWLCKCDCGNIASIYSSSLRSGRTKSCGCLQAENRKFIDLTGQRFGRLTVIERDFSRKDECTSAYWLCKCDCGNITSVSSSNLRRGNVKSCGCLRVIDLTGQRFGRLTVIERDLNNKGNGAYWLCKCDCGNIKSIYGGNLRSGNTKSCGCLRVIDLTGQRFGRLTVIERDFSRNYKDEYTRVYWLCKCDCGNIASVSGGSLRSGRTKSCGCLQAENRKQAKKDN